MSSSVSNLYQVLGLSADATPEQVRKAYRSKALKTHPDRLPPDATPDEKAQSEERFRRVNNAYEILNDPEKRRLYDLHGVWPPPQSAPYAGSSSRRHSHSHARPARDPFDHPFFNNAFTDPFELFDSIFANEFQPWHRSRDHRSSRPRGFNNNDFNDRMFNRPFGGNFFSSPMDSFFNGVPTSHPFGGQNMFSSSPFGAFPSVSFGGQGSGWTGESFMSTTVNGVTHTMHKRRDVDGTEHVYKTYPDGRKVHSINGVDQPNHGHLPNVNNNNNPLMIQNEVPPSYSSRHSSRHGSVSSHTSSHRSHRSHPSRHDGY